MGRYDVTHELLDVPQLGTAIGSQAVAEPVTPRGESSTVHAVELVGDRWIEWDSLDSIRDASGILWLDFCVTDASPGLEGELLNHCGGLTRPMLRDLFDRDEVAKVATCDNGVRSVSAVSARAMSPSEAGVSGPSHQDQGFAGALALHLVEILQGKDWLITCWHREKVLSGAESEPLENGCPEGAHLQRLRSDIESAWHRRRDIRGRTVGDLGVLILDELVSTYERAHIGLSARLDRWEREFYPLCASPDGGGVQDPAQIDQSTLVNLRVLTSELRRNVAPLDAPRRRAQTHWFTEVRDEDSAKHIDEVVDAGLESLDRLSDRIRSSFDLVHLQLSQANERSTKDLQDRIERITAVLLVPALIAAFFGANTWLPGGNDTNAMFSFEIMIAAMAVGCADVHGPALVTQAAVVEVLVEMLVGPQPVHCPKPTSDQRFTRRLIVHQCSQPPSRDIEPSPHNRTS